MTAYRIQYERENGVVLIQRVPEAYKATNLVIPVHEIHDLTLFLQELREQIFEYGPNVSTLTKEWTI